MQAPEIIASHTFQTTPEPVPYVRFVNTWKSLFSETILSVILSMFEKDIPVIRPSPDPRFFFCTVDQYRDPNKQEISQLLSNVHGTQESAESPYLNTEILDVLVVDEVFAAIQKSLQRMEESILPLLRQAMTIDDLEKLFAYYSYFEFAIESTFQYLYDLKLIVGGGTFMKGGLGYTIIGSEMSHIHAMIHARAAEIIEEKGYQDYSAKYHHWEALRAFSLSLSYEIGAPKGRKEFIFEKMKRHFDALGITF